MSATSAIADAAGVATAVGVLFGAAQLFFNRGQSRTAFEDDVARQYRSMIKPSLLDALTAPLKDSDRESVRGYYEYFDLCNEQVFLRLQGRVQRRTWVEWRKGIETNLSRAPISNAWAMARRELRDFEELRLLAESGYGDPRGWNPRWRRFLRREATAGERVVQLRARRQLKNQRPRARQTQQ